MNNDSFEIKVPVTVGRMYPSSLEYFGSEQHNIDLQEIVPKKENPVKILGKIKGGWMNDLQTACLLATKDLYRSSHHSDYLYITKLSDAIPTISKIPKILGFVGKTNAQIQMQRPGCNMTRHTDPPHMFVNPYRIQVLVTLAHWEYGQYLFFNNTIVKEWEPGTVIYTDFSNVWHSTSNMSWHTRPLLQIIGEPSEQLQNMLLDSKEHIFQL